MFCQTSELGNLVWLNPVLCLRKAFFNIYAAFGGKSSTLSNILASSNHQGHHFIGEDEKTNLFFAKLYALLGQCFIKKCETSPRGSDIFYSIWELCARVAFWNHASNIYENSWHCQLHSWNVLHCQQNIYGVSTSIPCKVIFSKVCRCLRYVEVNS